MLRAAMILLLVASGLAAVPQQGHAQPRPVLKRCPVLQPLRAGQIARIRPLDVPKTVAKVTRSSRDILAVSTAQGGTVCLDMRTKGKVGNFKLSPDSRFFSFDWRGYEAEGHVFVDRSGNGQEYNLASAPAFSSARARFAVMGPGSAGTADFRGLAIWEVETIGARQLAIVSNLPVMVDWRVDGWGGENCIGLSAIPAARVPDDGDLSSVNRDRFTARPIASTWRVTRVIGRGC